MIGFEQLGRQFTIQLKDDVLGSVVDIKIAFERQSHFIVGGINQTRIDSHEFERARPTSLAIRVFSNAQVLSALNVKSAPASVIISSARTIK
jgi:hypothetical protein